MRISILTPAHNEESYIEAMIESVLRQDHDDWELIIVIDRSTDDTASRAREFNDHRILVVEDPSVSGKNSAFNCAYRKARGDLIMIFGADDVMPPESLAMRVASLEAWQADGLRAASYGKVQMFSDDTRYDGVVVPRGSRGSRAGGTTTLTQRMAQIVFPLDESLPNEDVWISTVAHLLADGEAELPEIVVLYRIHDGNSFRRSDSYCETNAALAARNIAYELLLSNQRFSWSREQESWLRRRIELERWRRSGETARILTTRGEGVVNRLRLAVQSSRLLFAVRARAYRIFSGW